MIKSKWVGVLAAVLMVAAVAAMCLVYLYPGLFASVTASNAPAYAPAMDKTKVLDFKIIADEAQWEAMLENAAAEEYIPATVIINGTKIENVGIRPKGNSSLSLVAQDDTTDRFSFKIEFDHYITGQTWLGLDKIVVNNMQGDTTYMKEYLAYDIMDFAGVDAPLFSFADISLNGEAWGFYLAVEALDNSYAQRVYGKDYGNLYKPESMGMRGGGDINEAVNAMPDMQAGQAAPPQAGQNNLPQVGQAALPQAGNPAGQRQFGGGMGGMAQNGVSLQYTDNQVTSYSAIFDNAVFKASEKDTTRLIAALEKLAKAEDLEKVVDVEAVLRYFAAHTVVVNLDSYVSNMGHNYYLYEKNGQLTILPWDYNLAFGGFQSATASDVVNFPIDTPVSGVSLEERPLLGQLLAVPEYLEMYHSYLQQIADGYFASGQFEQTIAGVNSLITPYVQNDPTAFYGYEEYVAGVEELQKLGLLRAQSIQGQLQGQIPADSAGQAASPEKLLDSSSVNLSALGSQGGGGGFAPGGGGLQDADRETMQKAMEIILGAGGEELSEQQLEELAQLGLSPQQIEQMQTLPQGGPGGMGGPPQNMMQGRAGDFAAGQNPGGAVQQPAQSSMAGTWLVLGMCAAVLCAGLVFVVVFKRRRM